jgi:hypothetical protein
MSVGCAVARVLLLVALRSILFRVSVIVVCIVDRSSLPRCLIVAGVMNPWFWRFCVRSGVQLTHRIVDF